MSRKRGGEETGDTWLNTYADMVTLLMTFFVVMLSLSNTDTDKLNAFIRAFSNLPQSVVEEMTGPSAVESTSGAIPVSGTMPDLAAMDELYLALTNYVDEQGQSNAVDIFKVDDIIYIRFSDALFFEPNQYVLRDISLPTMQFIGDGLKQYEDMIKMVNVIGHTATIENGTYWMLSGERAAVVATYFNSNCGFDPQKLTVMGYGNQHPVATNDTEAGRIKNRRVELIIVGNDSEKNFNIYDTLGDFYDSTLYPTTGSPNEVLYPYTEDASPGAQSSVTSTPPPPPEVQSNVSPYA